jgi:general secretion pathway protein H
VIGAQRVILRSEDKQIVVGTDGLSPFAVITGDAAVDAEAAGGARAR